MSRGRLAKNWCVTSRMSEGAPAPQAFWDQFGPEGTGRVAFMAGQFEISRNGQHHTQWWLQLTRRERFTTLVTNSKKQPKKPLFDSKCDHVEACLGTEEENEKYTKKSDTGVEGSLFSFGSFSVQGKSNSMKEVVEMISEGKGWDDLYDCHAEFIMRGHHASAIRHAITYLRPSAPVDTFEMTSWPKTGGWKEASAWATGDRKTTLLLCGPPGCGKTKWTQSLKLGGKATLVAQTKDDLKLLTGKHSLVCLDDWDEELAALGPAQLTQLFDRQIDVSVKCRYEDAYISRETAMVVCSNADLRWVLDIHPGVPRRTTLVHVEAWDMDSSLAETAAEAKRNADEMKHNHPDYEAIDLTDDADMPLRQESINSVLVQDAEDLGMGHDSWSDDWDKSDADVEPDDQPSEEDILERQFSAASLLVFRQNGKKNENVSDYYARMAIEEQDGAEAAHHRSQLKRSNAQIEWSQHSSADTPSRKRKRPEDDDENMS